jgi:hypothetical protein
MEQDFNASPGIQTIIEFLERASRKGGLMRWEGLRKIGGIFAEQNIHIPLDKHGTLIEQFHGLTKWCAEFGSHLNFSENKASAIALAYVARQLQGANVLLNNQTEDTRRTEADKIIFLAEKVLIGPDDEDAGAIFHRVATHLKDPTQEADVGKLLRLANAAFYIETGVSAWTWADSENFCTWVLDNPRSGTGRGLIEGAKGAARLLGANAYGNNIDKLADYPDITARLLASLSAAERADIASAEYFQASIEKAQAASPSHDRMTESIAFGTMGRRFQPTPT